MSLCSRQCGPAAGSQGQARLFRADLHKLSPSSEISGINIPMTLPLLANININSGGNFAATAAPADAIIATSA